MRKNLPFVHGFKCWMATLALMLGSAVYAETVWIDVRSVPEHLIDNIEGDLRVSHTDIVERVSELYPDKETNIHLYCRSGGRAQMALTALQKIGYNNVSNVGSIGDARQARALSE